MFENSIDPDQEQSDQGFDYFHHKDPISEKSPRYWTSGWNLDKAIHSRM